MQFHYDGYVSGDPRVQTARGTGVDRPEVLPETVDVLIVGAGPAGMITAAQLSQYPDIVTRIIDRRPGRLEIGQADGIQARSVETFAAFGFAGRIIEEAYQETEMIFWRPDPVDPSRIVRGERTPDDPGGVSEFPHLLVNQARVLDFFAEFMAHSPTRMVPDYGYEFRGLTVAGDGDYPVSVTVRYPDGDERTVRARYVLGADGAHSAVRAAIGGTMSGDEALHAWGVMDVLAVTEFPDIRTKCAIQSEDGGNILLIPREGGYLFRMYVDLGEVAEGGARAVRDTTIDEIVDHANKIMCQYPLDVKHVAWHSVYEVAHRLTDRFDDAAGNTADDGAAGGGRGPRVFLAGDACHTHSAKAGQGMNVSMQDGFNLGWKLGSVLSGASPASLLRTYSAERREIAQNLIDFDKEWSSLMAKKVDEFADPAELADYYVRTWEFPAGFMTCYPPCLIVADATHQALATGYPIGKRFKSEPVVRVADAVPDHLGHLHRADGRWRLYAFTGTDTAAVDDWAHWMATDPHSPQRAHTPPGADPDARFDIKAIYPRPHDQVDITTVAPLFLPRRGRYQLIDYEKIYATDPAHDIYDLRGIDREHGALVVVRPDQYVAAVLPFHAHHELAAFFRPIMRATTGE